MLANPSLRWLVGAIVTGNRHIYMRFQYPALFNIHPDRCFAPTKWLFPKEGSERTQFSNIARAYSEERISSTDKARQDIMSALLAAKDPKTGQKLADAEIWGEAHLMIAAGRRLFPQHSEALASAYKSLKVVTQLLPPWPPSSSIFLVAPLLTNASLPKSDARSPQPNPSDADPKCLPAVTSAPASTKQCASLLQPLAHCGERPARAAPSPTDSTFLRATKRVCAPTPSTTIRSTSQIPSLSNPNASSQNLPTDSPGPPNLLHPPSQGPQCGLPCPPCQAHRLSRPVHLLYPSIPSLQPPFRH